MIIIVENHRLGLLPATPAETTQVRALVTEMRFTVESHTPTGRQVREVRLLRRDRKLNGWRGPPGLLDPILDAARRHGLPVSVRDERAPWTAGVPIRWAKPIRLRDYQEEVLGHRRLAGDPSDLRWGRTVVSACVRAGKTIMTAADIRRDGVQTLFVVSSASLLLQAYNTFANLLRLVGSTSQIEGRPLVGAWGAGKREPGWVTVATVQALLPHLGKPRPTRSLAVRPVADPPPIPPSVDRLGRRRPGKRRARWPMEMLKAAWRRGEPFRDRTGNRLSSRRVPQGVGTLVYGGRPFWTAPGVDPKVAREVRWMLRSQAVYWDEVQHLTGEEWRGLLGRMSRARKCVGLSGTVRDPDFVQLEADVWITAATGPIGPRVTMSQLLRSGWLCRPVIRMVRCTIRVPRRAPWREAQSALVHSKSRKGLVAAIVKRERDRGGRILVRVGLVEHARVLATALRLHGVRVSVVTGETGTDERRATERLLHDRRIDAIVGTVYGEGVDLPSLRVVVNAAGGQSWIDQIQGMRNLTPYSEEEGGVPSRPMDPAPEAPVYDFLDYGHPTLEAHSMQRLREYRRHDGFRVIMPPSRGR